jgi:hypothetical protein
MRIIVEAFKETLELGLNKPGQVVVRSYLISPSQLDRSIVKWDICFYILFDGIVARYILSCAGKGSTYALR